MTYEPTPCEWACMTAKGCPTPGLCADNGECLHPVDAAPPADALVERAYKAAMYDGLQQEKLARQTLYWKLADRIAALTADNEAQRHDITRLYESLQTEVMASERAEGREKALREALAELVAAHDALSFHSSTADYIRKSNRQFDAWAAARAALARKEGE